MKIAEADILIVPGLNGSDTGHWQQRWIQKMTNAFEVGQRDWDHPDKDEWAEVLERAIVMATRPVVLVGHSLGVLTIAHTATRLADTKVRGAFLVAPPDVEVLEKTHPEATGFAPVPRDPLPFPSLLVASQNDDYCSAEAAADLGNAWGSDFHLAGDAGHINIESGHGPWPEGLMMFTRLMQRI